MAKRYFTTESFEALIENIKNIDKKLFIGTQAEYDTAMLNNQIAIGSIVIITDDENSTTSKLGKAVLGQMKLGAA